MNTYHFANHFPPKKELPSFQKMEALSALHHIRLIADS